MFRPLRLRRVATGLGSLLAVLLVLVPVPGATAQDGPPPTFPDPPADVVAGVGVSPAANTPLNWPPRAIRLSFPEPVTPEVAEVTLSDEDGLRYPPVTAVTAEGSDLVLSPPSLPAGVYTVTWKGPFPGSYRFALTVGNSEELGPTEQAAINGGGSTIAEDSSSDPLPFAVFLLPPALLLAVVLALRLRPRRAGVAAGVLLLLAAAGTSVALEPSPSAAEGRLRCLALSGEPRLTCLSEVAVERYETGGIPAVLDELRSLDADVRFRPEYGEHVCHSVAHMAARVVVAREGSISRAVKDADLLCASGFLHGVLEGGAPLVPTATFAEEVKGVCGAGVDEAALECAHGVGHGAALRLNSRLRESTDVCLALANRQQAVQCVLGASMLYGSWIGNMAARSPDPAQYTAPGSPVGEIGEVCLDDRFTGDPELLRACLEGTFFYMKSGPEPIARLPRAWSEIGEIGSWCADLAASRPDLEVACFSGLGSASALRLHESPENMPGVCSAAPSEDGVRSCVISLVTQIRNNSGNSPEFNVYERICARVPEFVSADCLRTSERLHQR